MAPVTKRTVPGVPRSSLGSDRQTFDEALKNNLEVLMGQRGSRIAELPSTASLDDVIRKVNELIRLLQ